MTSNLAPRFELVLVFGAVVGFGVWQLVSLRRDRQAREKDERGSGELGPDEDGVKRQEPREHEGRDGGVGLVLGQAEPAEDLP